MKATYGTGVFVLAHAGTEVPKPAGGLLPTVAWSIDGRVEYALDGGVFAAGAMLEWMCNELGLAEDPPALSALAREVGDSAGARVLPALAGIGAPWWRPERPRGDLGNPRRHQRGQRRPGGAGGDRLAGRRRGRRDPGDDRGRDPAGGRRAHQRTAAAPASGGHDRGAGRGRRRRRHGARRGRPRRGRQRGDRLARAASRAAPPGSPGRARARRRLALGRARALARLRQGDRGARRRASYVRGSACRRSGAAL